MTAKTRTEILQFQRAIAIGKIDYTEKQLRQALSRVEEIDEELQEISRAEFKALIENAPTSWVAPAGHNKTFYLVVGQGYDVARTPHPIYPGKLLGDRYLIVESPSYDWARMMIWVHIGKWWSSLYEVSPATSYPESYFKGATGRMHSDGTITWFPPGYSELDKAWPT